MKRIILLMLCSPSLVIAQAPPDWTKQENPEELFVFISVPMAADCPILLKKELHKIAGDALRRTRIKPLDEWTSPELVLTMRLLCTPKIDRTGWHFYLVTNFRILSEVDDTLVEIGPPDLRTEHVGETDRDGLLRTAKEQIEEMLTIYLKANFDLGEQE